MIEEIIEISPIIAALSTVIAAIVLWKVVFGIPLISGYGVGQRKDNNMKELITEDKVGVPMPQREVIIVSGNLHSGHWSKKPWIQWLEKIHKEQNINIKVITGPDNDKASMNMIKKLVDGGAIELKNIERRETMHFFIIDEDWAHIEKKHIGPEIPGGIRVKHLFPGPRRELCGRFEKLWKEAKPVTPKNIESIFAS